MSVWYKSYENRIVEIIHNDPEIMPDPEAWSEVPEVYRDFITMDYIVDVEGAVVPPSLEYYEQQLFAKLATIRWEHQSTPVSIRGMLYSPKPDDMGTLANTIQLGKDFEASPSNLQQISENGAEPLYENKFVTNWKAVSGFVAADLKMLESIGRTLGAHVQACFANEARIAANIRAAETAEDKLSELNIGLIDRPWSIYILPSFDPVSANYQAAPTYTPPSTAKKGK